MSGTVIGIPVMITLSPAFALSTISFLKMTSILNKQTNKKYKIMKKWHKLIYFDLDIFFRYPYIYLLGIEPLGTSLAFS